MATARASERHAHITVHDGGTHALSASQLGAAPGTVLDMMQGAQQSDNMNVNGEQSAHEEHGLASRTRERMLAHTRHDENAYNGTSGNGAERGDDGDAEDGAENSNRKRSNERRTCE